MGSTAVGLIILLILGYPACYACFRTLHQFLQTPVLEYPQQYHAMMGADTDGDALVWALPRDSLDKIEEPLFLLQFHRCIFTLFHTTHLYRLDTCTRVKQDKYKQPRFDLECITLLYTDQVKCKEGGP